MLVGYMRVSTDGDRQVLDLQRDALLAAGVDERHLFDDRASGSRGDRAGLARALAFIKRGDCLVRSRFGLIDARQATKLQGLEHALAGA